MIVKSPLGQAFTGLSDPHPVVSDQGCNSKKSRYIPDAEIPSLTTWTISLVAGTASVGTLNCLASAERRRVMWLDLDMLQPCHQSNQELQR